MNRLTNILVVAFLLFPFAELAAKDKSRFEQLELFNKVLYMVEGQYYREVDRDKLVEGAIKGMLDTLDPHSAFLSKEFFKKMKNETDGEFGGLGIEVAQKEGVIYIVTPIDDTPAFRAGLKPKDKIVEINHVSIVGMTLDEVIDRMKGKEGSYISLGVIREGVKGIKNFKLKREIIKLKPVKSKLLSSNYAWVRLTQFQRNSAKYIENALAKMEKKSKKKGGLRGIVLDLRSNPGGLLDQAVDVSSLFLDKGVVVSTEARDPNNKDIRFVKKTGKKYLDIPLVVLVNGASASASEIVAGALQDHGRALIMGSTTFGKGSVQTVTGLGKKGEYGLKLTIAQYMTPSKKKIQAIGIKPDIELDEYDADWSENNKTGSHYVREMDLKNHLTATIETKEEKKIREKQEAEKRQLRIQALKDNKKKKGKKEDELFKKYDPKTDFQIIQAINFLKSFKVYEKFLKKEV